MKFKTTSRARGRKIIQSEWKIYDFVSTFVLWSSVNWIIIEIAMLLNKIYFISASLDVVILN